MNNKEEFVYANGTVQRVFQRHQYEVKLNNGHVLFGTLNGRLIKHRIWCHIGDVVELEISVYDLTKCRIIKRM